MADQFIMCTRAVENGQFVPKPGKTVYLIVPEGKHPMPEHKIKAKLWLDKLRKAAIWGPDSRNPKFDRGDLLIYIHGYDNTQEVMMQRHATLKQNLIEAGYKGELMSFDWPSDNKALNYLDDRHDAKQTAMQLVTDGISALSERQTPDCTINIHVIGHSTGAYVIREAFDDADDARLANNGWAVSQVVFIGGDISSASLSSGNSSTESLYRHCTRLTNYSNLYDSVLKLSNAKRLGMAPRVGRIGLPSNAPEKAVNIDCTEYFGKLQADAAVKKEDQPVTVGAFDHSWHIGNKIFTRDLFETLKGDIDRTVIPTRYIESGSIKLKRA
ncbi:MAG: alpha/beta hydrolase [bacterium]